MCSMWLYITTLQNTPCTPVGKKFKGIWIINPIVSKNWMISRQPWWQYLWSISISPGIPNSGRRKMSLFRNKFRAGNKWPTKIGDPRSTICISMLCHGSWTTKKGQYWIHFLQPETDWDQLVSLTVTASQPTCCKYFTSYLLQASKSKVKLKLFVAFRPDENEMLLEWLAIDHEQCGCGQRQSL